MMNFIKQNVRTEKTLESRAFNKFVLSVDIRLTKPQIKKICEEYFGVKIKSVNTHINPLQKKRFGLQQGYKSRYKRAIITVKKGEVLPFGEKEQMKETNKNES